MGNDLDPLLQMLPRELVIALAQTTSGGGSSPSASDLSVLYCNGVSQHIDHGSFWTTPGKSLGNAMLWEAWFMGDPFTPSGYIVSDGYGGAHALLWSGASGNISFKDGGGADQIVSFSSPSNLVPGVFNHCRVRLLTDSFSNVWIITDINGICVGKTLVPTGYVRAVVQGSAGQGTLYVMGSDHSNAKGWLAMLRAWEQETTEDGTVYPGLPFVPDRAFGVTSVRQGLITPPVFLASYVAPPGTPVFPDLSMGYDCNGASTRTPHAGFAGNGDVGVQNYFPLPAPRAIVSPSTKAPFYYGYVPTAPDRGYTPISPPTNAKRYDSFSRPDQTYAHVALPNVGHTESGSLGPATWQARTMNGAALSNPVLLQLFDHTLRAGDINPTLAWIPAASDSADMSVEGTRVDPSGGNADGVVGLAARVADDGSTCFYAMYQFIPGSGSIAYLFRMDAPGTLTFVTQATVPQLGWSTLRLVCSGSTISVYTDATQVISVTDTNFATQKGAGIVFPGYPTSTHWACANWTVF